MDFIITTALKKILKLARTPNKRRFVVKGGSSASKTFSILPFLIDKAIKNNGSEISIVSESMPHLRRGCIKDFLKIMHATGRYEEAKWNRTTNTYKFSNGSFIEFFSVDQHDKLRGARRTDLYINECNNVSFEAYNQLAVRTSGDIWLDYNPIAAFWVDEQVIPLEDSCLLTLTYKDNEALSDAIVADIESAREKGKTSSYWANWWRVYGLGLTGNLEGACIKDWDTVDMLPVEARLLCIGLDFGYTNDPSSAIAMYKWNDAYIYDEIFYQVGMLNNHITKKIMQEGLQDELIYADSAEPKSIAQLNLEGLTVLPVKKSRDSIVNGISLINQQKIYVTSRSKNLINELQNYVWMKDKSGNQINKPIDAWNHAIDAMRYATFMQLDNPHKGEYHIW